MPITQLTNAQLQALMAHEPEVLLLDVRTLPEFLQLGHLPNAHLLPVQELPARVGELDPQAKTVVICQHGVRSWDACQYLAARGFTQLYNLTHGMAAWSGPLEVDHSLA